MLFVTTIFSITMITLLALLPSLLKPYYRAKAQITVFQDAKHAYFIINRDVKTAQGTTNTPSPTYNCSLTYPPIPPANSCARPAMEVEPLAFTASTFALPGGPAPDPTLHLWDQQTSPAPLSQEEIVLRRIITKGNGQNLGDDGGVWNLSTSAKNKISDDLSGNFTEDSYVPALSFTNCAVNGTKCTFNTIIDTPVSYPARQALPFRQPSVTVNLTFTNEGGNSVTPIKRAQLSLRFTISSRDYNFTRK